jgi:DNA repair exonuclease SbcCD nuclease subunit
VNKILVVGDTHLTPNKPRNRTDNYKETVLRKFQFILDLAKKEGCRFVLQPGDLFDSPDPSYSFYAEIYDMIRFGNGTLITIPGQHDMKYRRLENTGIAALSKTHTDVIIAGHLGIEILPGVFVYGSPFDTEIPEPISKGINILLAHRMVVKEKLWEDQTNFEYGFKLLQQHPKYDLMVTGDNHQNFVIDTGSQVLINAGSLMRSTIAQIDHVPKAYIVELSKNEISDVVEVYIPFQPADEVFKIDDIIAEKEKDANLKAYIEGLKSHKAQDLQFEDELSDYLKENNIEKSVVDILNKAKEEKEE